MRPDLPPNDVNLVRVEQAVGDGAAPGNPLLQLHRALRGRYPLVLALAVVAGLIGAAGGWLATKPLFDSQGWIRAFPRQARVLYETDENKTMPMFEAFVRSQADLIRSRRVLDLAMNEQDLREAGWPAAPEGVEELTRRLQVVAARGSELISVTVSHQNPQLAQLAANAVLTAFMKYQEEQDGLSATDRERRLRENQRVLTAELQTVRESILRVGDRFGGADPDVLLPIRTEQLARVDAQLADPAIAAAAESGAPAPSAPAPVGLAGVPLTELARLDEPLAQLLRQKQSLELEIDTISRTLGPSHRQIASLKQRMTGLDQAIEARAAEVRRMPMAIPGGGVSGGGAVAGMDPAAAAKQYRATRERLSAEVKDLARGRLELKSLVDRQTEIERRLGETNQAIEVIRVEDEIIRGGRVRIQQRAATPLAPTKDQRIPLAAAGFLGGSGAVVGGVVLLSLMRRKLRYADELASVDGMLPLVGVIPEVRAGDPDAIESIVLALHHVRNSLLLFRRPERNSGTVYLVSSSVAGEGKTTVGIALGASFAQAGYRTVLVDGDLIGRGLTRELGFGDQAGLVESLGSENFDGQLYDSHVPGMRVLPAGHRQQSNAHELTLEELEPLVTGLRSRFDIVIIDTGPILGSLEVGLLAQVADTLLMVSARGTASQLVNAAMDRARRVARNGIALVFNRAHGHDLTTSLSYSSVRSRAEEPRAARGNQPTDRQRLVRLLTPGKVEPEARDRADG